MQEKLYFEGSTLYAKFILLIPEMPQRVWEYITQTEKIYKWFPDIEVGKLDKQGYLIFKLPQQDIHMPISAFKSEKLLSYTWGANGTVRFEIIQLQEGTQLEFLNILPEDFPNRSRDVTGWSIALEQLRNAILDKPVEYNLELHQERKKKYDAAIASLQKNQ
ncbi:SRPBCC domain-containing protein [Lacrimispora sp.]|uniref:SRPBCC domain-containing protein n=1 Tax=Lacrimispora sp. TaxID=2719234 RepID=UPI002FD9E971